MSNHSCIVKLYCLCNRSILQILLLLIVTLLGACKETTHESYSSPLTNAPTDLIERGEYLAKASNCVGCHTPIGQEEFSGGRAIPTPFGDVMSSNLTSDAETGLGKWSQEDFWQALHNGKSRDGRSLYPAFPYPSYSLITRDDSDALFAYLQSIPAIKKANESHRLRFPYNSQWALNIWRTLYFNPTSFAPDVSQPDDWNRGAYLVNALGHCAACHTPRGSLGNYNNDKSFAGTYIEGLDWDAPPLANGNLSEQQQEQMLILLKNGINERDVFSGPMAEVVLHSLQYLTPEDLASMVNYLASLPVVKKAEKKKSDLDKESLLLGKEVYEEHCADCHGENGEGEPYRYPALAGNSAVNTASPRNAIRSLMFGGFGASTAGRPRPYGMPAFAQDLSDEEAAAVLSYIRSAWGNTASAVNAVNIWR